ncbi:MAG: hypothetical protein PGN24_01250, partial [Microbacterium arborescens]
MGTVWAVGNIAVIAGVVIVVTIILFIWAARRAQRRADSSPVVSLALSLSALWAVFGLIGAVISVVQNLTLSAPRMSVPVALFWPELLPGLVIDSGPTARVDGGGFQVAEVDVAGVSPV